MSSKSTFCKHQGKRVLLLEGTNDCHVVMAVCVAHEVPETFGLYECGSDDQVIKRLNALIVSPDIPDVLGVMLDADQDLGARWQGIAIKLQAHGYEVPKEPITIGTIIDSREGLPKIGIWLMPNNVATGMLEDFCLEMVENTTREYVEQVVATAQEKGVCTFKAPHISKAVVHTYLAWQDDPGAPLGLSITKQALKPETETATAFTNWLKTLFAA